jgi:GDP-mannose 6-dehydrogenase
MRISVFGMGYVGSVSAACLASSGHKIIGVDSNGAKVKAINDGRSPIVEPGLNDLVAACVKSGRLRATTDAADAVENSDVAMVCVGTPSRANGELDLEAVTRVCHDIGRAVARHQRPYTLVIRSTVLPGTTEKVVLPAVQKIVGTTSDDLVSVAVNPEFMREGSALKDFMDPPVTVVGCEDSATANILRLVYANLNARFVHTGIRTAEMVKYAANAYHALKVCFANEIGNVCHALGADGQEVMEVFCMDRKLNISSAYLRPGFAFGGSCLPKDVRALTHAARRADVDLPVLNGILPSNEGQIRRAIELVLATGKRRIGVVGLTFKPETDDLRESPMVALVEALIGKGCGLRIFDENVQMARLTGANRRHIQETVPHITALMCDDKHGLIDHSDVWVIGSEGELAEWAKAAAKPGQVIVDLTQGALQAYPSSGGEPSCESRIAEQTGGVPELPSSQPSHY